MQATAIHWLGEFQKLITYTEVVWSVTTTYIWYADYYNSNSHKNFSSSSDINKPIFRIKKLVETVSWWITTEETFSPLINWKINNSYELVRDDWSSNFLNYTYI